MRAKALGFEPTNFSHIPNYFVSRATTSYIHKDDGIEKEDDNSFTGILYKIRHISKSLAHYCTYNKHSINIYSFIYNSSHILFLVCFGGVGG